MRKFTEYKFDGNNVVIDTDYGSQVFIIDATDAKKVATLCIELMMHKRMGDELLALQQAALFAAFTVVAVGLAEGEQNGNRSNNH